MFQEPAVIPATVDHKVIVASVVPEARRLGFLSDTFGSCFMLVEASVCEWMERLCPEYHGGQGGLWDFIELSSGGGYLAPTGSDCYNIRLEGHGVDGCLGASAAGIVVTAFALSSLVWQGCETLCERHGQLIEYADQHPEAAAIRQAIG